MEKGGFALNRGLICLAVAALPFVVGFAVADSADNYPPSSGALARALGADWVITSPTGTLEARRQPRTQPATDLDVRLHEAARMLQQRDDGIAVDLSSKGSVHLAGNSADCDRVVIAAQQFAAIHGVNALIIDTACRPRD